MHTFNADSSIIINESERHSLHGNKSHQFISNQAPLGKEGVPYSSRGNLEGVEHDNTIEHIFPEPINSNRTVKTKTAGSIIT